MATVIDSLLVSLGFDADVGGANRFDASLNNVLGTIGKISTAIVGAGTLISGFAVGLTLDNAATIDETERLAMVANVTTQELQYLTAGADRFNISQEKLSDMLKDVNDKMGDFISSGGGEMKDFFENIADDVGITAESFKNLSGQDALQLYYDTLEKANLSQSQMTFYMEAIANDATMLIPLLRNSGEEFTKWGDKAAAAGLVMSDSQLDANRMLIENQKQVKIMMQGIKQSVSTAVAPLLNQFFDFLFLNQPQIERFIAYFGDKFESLASAVSGNMDRVVSVFDLLFDSLFELWDAALWARDGLKSLMDQIGLTEHGGKLLAGVIGLIAANLAGLAAVKALSMITSMARGFMLLFSPLALIGVALIAFLLIVEDVYGFLNGKDSLIGGLIQDYPVIGEVIGMVMMLVDAFKSIWTENQDTFKELWDALNDLVIALKPLFVLLVDILPPAFKLLLQIALVVIQAIALAVGVLVTVFTDIVESITAIWKGLWSVLSFVFDGFFDYITNKISAIVGMVGGLISGVKSIADGDIMDGIGIAGGALFDGGKQFLSAHSVNYNANNSGRPSYMPAMGGQASINNESTVTQHINVNSAAEAALIASRTAQGTRERTNGYQ